MYRAELISQALTIAGLGVAPVVLMMYCRAIIAAPAISGVECEGPLEEKPTMSLALSASESGTPQLKSGAPKGWTLLAAPAVMMFLAVPGEPTVLAPAPALPAAKTMIISWFPAVGNGDPAGWASR